MLLLEFEIVCANVKINSCSVVRYTQCSVWIPISLSIFDTHHDLDDHHMGKIWWSLYCCLAPARTPPHFQTGAAQYGHKYAHELSPISIKSIMTPLHSLRRSHIVPTTSNLFINNDYEVFWWSGGSVICHLIIKLSAEKSVTVALAQPKFGSLVKPISNQGDRLCLPHYCLHTSVSSVVEF